MDGGEQGRQSRNSSGVGSKSVQSRWDHAAILVTRWTLGFARLPDVVRAGAAGFALPRDAVGFFATTGGSSASALREGLRAREARFGSTSSSSSTGEVSSTTVEPSDERCSKRSETAVLDPAVDAEMDGDRRLRCVGVDELGRSMGCARGVAAGDTSSVLVRLRDERRGADVGELSSPSTDPLSSFERFAFALAAPSPSVATRRRLPAAAAPRAVLPLSSSHLNSSEIRSRACIWRIVKSASSRPWKSQGARIVGGSASAVTFKKGSCRIRAY
jgi:hypothetical protein